MKKIFKYIVLLLIVSSATLIHAQDAETLVKISGIVINQKGLEVPGASVYTLKSKDRTLTNASGQFEIEVNEEDQIMILCNGYYSNQFAYSEEESVDTILLTQIGSDNQSVDYQLSQSTLPFERITGAVERITGEELLDYPSIYVQEAIAGRLSGVTSYYGSADPTSESFGRSIRNGFSETYIDGAPAAITETAEEVDEIIIAKDYASSLFYGGTSPDGAFIMHTKRGQASEQSIKFSASTGLRTPTYVQEMMNSAQYAGFYNSMLAAEGKKPLYSPEDIKAYNSGNPTVKYPDNNYAEDLLSSSSTYTSVAGDFSGGNENATYYSHIDYYGTDGIESVGEGRNFMRLRTKNNIEMYLGDYARIDLGVGASYSSTSGPSASSTSIFNIHSSYPTNAFPYEIYEDSVYGKVSDFYSNPLAALEHGRVFDRSERDVSTRLGLNLDLGDITEGLQFNALYSIYVYDRLEKYNAPVAAMGELYHSTTAAGNDTVIIRNFHPSEDDPDWHKGTTYVSRAQYMKASLDYQKDFTEDHSLFASLIADNKVITGSLLSQDNVRRIFGGSANYMYSNKYVFDLSIMKSLVQQTLNKGANKANYAGGAAWLLHKEDFLKSSDWLSMLKLRANYGVTNLSISTYYLESNLYGSSGAGTFGIPGSTASSSGYNRTFTASPDITLPRQSYLSAGVDFAFLDGMFSGQANYFNMHTTDNVISPTGLYPVFSANGDFLPLINYGDSERYGFDGRLRYSDSHGDFRWLVDANMMYHTSYITSFNHPDYPELDRNINGNFSDRILGLESDGFFASQDEIDAAVHHSFGPVSVGDVRYVDTNEDNIIDEKDYHEIGNLSRISYGLNLAFSYKAFTLSAHADGKLGGSYVETRYNNRGQENYMVQALDNASLPRMSTTTEYNNSKTSDIWLRSASYLNLRSVSLVYQLPQSILMKTPVKDASVRLSGKNLLVLSENDDIYMPSRNAGYLTTPVMNAYEIGLNVKF